MWGAPIRLSARGVSIEGALISSIVTQGAVYGRFADKEALVLANLREFRDERLAPLVFQASAPEQSPLDELDTLSSGIATLSKECPAAPRMLARLVVELVRNPEPLGDAADRDAAGCVPARDLRRDREHRSAAVARLLSLHPSVPERLR